MNDELRTDRLLLRQWRDDDRQPFAALNNDSDVMQHFPRRFTREESDRFIDDNVNRISTEGWGAWAVESIVSGNFIGFVGFSRPADWHPCAGEIDVGWRLGRTHWGYGYATEAAKCALQFGFDSIGFVELVSFTSECNLASISVMRKIGMRRDAKGFVHPRIDAGNRLKNHVLFRLTKNEWENEIK